MSNNTEEINSLHNSTNHNSLNVDESRTTTIQAANENSSNLAVSNGDSLKTANGPHYRYDKDVFLALKDNQIRHPNLSHEYDNDKGLFNPSIMIRKQWERDGIIGAKKPKLPAILKLLKTRSYVPTYKPLTPSQMAVLEGINVRKLADQPAPIKMSVEEFMSKFQPNGAFSFSHQMGPRYPLQTGMSFLSHVTANYPHLVSHVQQHSPYKTSGSGFFGLPDDSGDAKFPIFRPPQRSFGFVPVGRPMIDQENYRHFSPPANPPNTPNVNLMRPRSGTGYMTHRFSSTQTSDRALLSSYDSFGFPWNPVQVSSLEPRYVLPTLEPRANPDPLGEFSPPATPVKN